MKKSIHFIAALLICLSATLLNDTVYAQTTNFVWAKAMGAAGTDNIGNSITTDASGNIYTTGSFQGTVDFDPGTGVVNLTSSGGNDVFISKLNASGNLVWAKSLSGTVAEYTTGIAVDTGGNVYTIGYFYGTTDFDPGVGTYSFTQAGGGGSSVFISKLNSSGAFVWAKAFMGVNINWGASIALDANGSVYTTGYFFGTVDFDPSATAYNLSSAGGTDIFVSKLDANGNFVWAKKMGGTGGDAGTSIAIDGNFNIYTTGSFAGTADFDPSATVYNLASLGSSDIFILKLDQLGNLVWAKAIGGTSNDGGNAIAIDGSGNIYTGGNFGATVDFDPGANPLIFNLTSVGGNDIFINKLDASGNFIWARAMGGTGADNCSSIALNSSGEPYTTGYFVGTADFDPSSGGTFNLISSGGQNIFISKLSTTGSFILAKSIGGGTGTNNGNDITTNSGGVVYTTGSFQGTVDFDQDAGIFTLTSTGNTDIFVHKMVQCNTSVTTTQTEVSCFGGNDGTANATLTGGTAPYTYLWQYSNDAGGSWTTMFGETSASVSSFSAGSNDEYSVTVTDFFGCVASANLIFSQPTAISLTSSQTNVSCFGSNNGSATVTATGGNLTQTATSMENWEGANTWTIVNGISNKWWVGTATANGGLKSMYISNDAGSTNLYSGSATSVNHFYKDFTFPSAATNISIKFDWKGVGESGWDDLKVFLVPTTTTPVAGTVLTTGQIGTTYGIQSTYITSTITGLDANAAGSTKRLVFTWRNDNATAGLPPAAIDNISVTYDYTVPYTYSWNTSPVQTTQTATGLSAGALSVTVTDANSCTAIKNLTIVQPTAISITTTQTNVNCFGGNNGYINSTVAGGVSPYSYSWSNSLTTSSISNLPAGTYVLTVTDLTGCTATKTVTITQPPAALAISAIHTDVSCFGGNDALANIMVTGTTTSPYTCSWSTSPVQTGFTANNLSPGTYSATVTDAVGCTASTSVAIMQPTALSVSTTGNTTICAGQSAAISGSASGGSTPYTYSWTPAGTELSCTTCSSSVATPSTSTSYILTVLDANNCSASGSVNITVNPLPPVTISGANFICTGNTATLTASGATSFLWSPGGYTTATISVSPTNTTPYTVTGSSAACSAIATHNLTVNPLPTVTVPANSTLCANGTIAGTNFTSNLSGSTFTWTNSNTSIGLAASGSGNIASFTATNSTSSPITATITVTPTSAAPASCTGTSSAYTITVNPRPAVTVPADITLCANGVVAGTNFSSSLAGSTYTWTNSNTAIGLASSGSGNITSFTATNNTSSPISSLITVTPTSAVPESCPGTPSSYVISVNPNAAITLTSAVGTNSQTICNNTAITSITYSITGGGTSASVVGLPTGITGSLAGNVFTISGTPTETGTFNYTITTTGTCSQATVNGTIIVNPNASIALTSGVGTNAQTLCINAAITSITYSITGGGTGAGITGLPAGITGSFAGGVFTINGTPTTSGSYNYTVTSTGICSQATVNGTIIVNSNASIALTSAVGTNAQTLCINTAITSIKYSITGGGTGAGVTGLPAGLTGSFSGGMFTISGTPTGSGTFNYEITTTGTCAQTTANGSISVNPNAAIALTSAVGTNAQTLCINAAITSITYSVTDGGTGAGLTGLPMGVTGSFAGGVFTITGTPTTSGTFNYTVTTTGTCTQTAATGSIIVNPIPAITSIPFSNESVCGANDGTIMINATGTGLTYSINGGVSFVGTSNFTGLAGGSYSVVVENSTGCTVNGGVISISSAGAPAMPTASATQNPLCAGSDLTLSVASPLGGETYTWSGPGAYSVTGTSVTRPGITSAMAGIYTVTASVGSCVSTGGNITIIVNPNAEIVLTSAAGTNTQTMCINTAITPITYSVTGGGTGAGITGLPVGLTGAFSGGVFTISGTPTVSGTFNYTVTTTGTCVQTTATGSITVNPNAAIAITSAVGTDAQTLCMNTAITPITYSVTAGGSGASITGLPAGTTGSFAGGVFTISGTPTVSGTFNYTVTTTGTCVQTTATGSITVNPNAAIALTSAVGTNAQTLCMNTAITSITYSVTAGGSGAGITGLPAGTTGSFAGGVFTISGTPTVSGTFNYTVTTTGTCAQTTATGSITVNPNAAIALTSAVGTDAQTLCMNTAISPITYSVTAGGSGAGVTGLPAGITGSFAGGVFTISGTSTISGTFNYSITTTGTCLQTAATGSITVNPNAAIALTSAVGTDAQTLCMNTAITSITYSVTAGGSGAGITGLPAGITGSFAGGVFTISGTPTVSGTFNYTITTTGTCAQTTATGSITVNPNAAIALSSAVGTDAQTLCINAAITSITYSVTGGGSGAGVTGLPAGTTGSFTGGVFTISGTPTVSGTFNYTVSTTGTCNQAIATGSLIVNSIPSAPTAFSNSPVNVGNTLSLTASTIIGADYSWSGPNGFSSFLQNPILTGITLANMGTYSVTATINGCTSLAGTTSVAVFTLAMTTTQTNVSCTGGINGAAAVLSVTGGTAPYTYAWNTSPVQTTQAIFNLAAGIYSVTVTDVNGFSVTASVNIIQPSAISIFTNPTNVSCYGGSNGTANAIAGGGTSPYTYLWNTFPIQNTAAAANLSAGNYTVTVTDANNCTSTNTVAITQPTALSVTMAIVNADCGSTNGDATADVTGGTSPYTYLWSTTATTSQIFNLASQNYTVTVTDSKGCSLNSIATVGLIPANFNLAFSASPQNGPAPLPGTFANNTPNMNNYNFTWFWGDGNSVNDNNATVFYTYNFAGTYDVALIATNIANGCQDTLAKHPYINVTGTGCGHTATVTPAGTVNKCQGDTLILTAGTNASASFTYQWNIGSVTISGANNSTLEVTQGGYYSVTIIKNNCPVTSSAVVVNFKTNPQQPTITSTGTIVPCLGGSVTLTSSTIAGATYSWNTNPVETTQSINVSASGNYIVMATNSWGCTTSSAQFSVNASYTQVPICMVTVDALSTHNILLWDKTGYASIDSFKIYREVTTNTYAYIASVSYDSLSEYHDLDANPNATSYKYKLTSKDSCGNESAFSYYHNTIHLQNLGGGNLQWTPYGIENSGNPVVFYRINRDDTNSGNFLPISSTIPGGNTTYTDVDYNLFPNANYRVDVAWGISCAPTRATINTTRSNIKGQGISIGIQTNEGSFQNVTVYPNPANESVTIELAPQTEATTLKIINVLGQLMEAEIIVPASTSKILKQINVTTYAKGIYTVSIENGGKKKFKKLIVN